MAAVVRVKRKINEDPANSLLLSCKRVKSERKPDVTDNNEVKSVFKFAGTVKSKNAQVSSHVQEAIRCEKLQREYKQHTVNVIQKCRKAKKNASTKDRFKVVSTHRAINLPSLDCGTEVDEDAACQDSATDKAVSPCTSKQQQICTQRNDKCDDNNLGSECSGKDDDDRDAISDEVLAMFCLYDVEHETERAAAKTETDTKTNNSETITCNNVPMVREKVPTELSPEYVYDIYYMNSAGFDMRVFENICAIEAFRGEDYLCGDDDDVAEMQMYEEDEDSNDEGNYRNDYPDEDPDGYRDDEDDFCYGAEEHEHQVHGYREDSGLSEMIGNRLKICDSDDSSDDDECSVQPTDGASLWKAGSSYDSYRRRIERDLREDYNDEDSDDMS